MFKISITLLFYSVYLYDFAQDRQYSTTDKEAIKNYALASQSLDENLYDEAIQYLYKAVQRDDKFIEAHAQLPMFCALKGSIPGCYPRFLKDGIKLESRI
jgi:hypothetical protein